MENSTTNIETSILLRLVNDDLDAFDELYWKYQSAVYQNVFKLIKEEESTADIVQDVFIKLWEKRKSIDCERPVGGWLFVSSYNRSINVLKKKLRENLLYKSLEISSVDVSSPVFQTIQKYNFVLKFPAINLQEI